MNDTVRLTVVPNEGAAEILCRLLRTEGIRCAHRQTNVGSGAADASWSFGGWREVLVFADDLERARDLLVDAELPEAGADDSEPGAG